MLQSTYSWTSADKSLTVSFETFSMRQISASQQRLTLGSTKRLVTLKQSQPKTELAGKEVLLVTTTVNQKLQIDSAIINGSATASVACEDGRSAITSADRIEYRSVGTTVTSQSVGHTIIDLRTKLGQTLHLTGNKGNFTGSVDQVAKKTTLSSADIDGNVIAVVTNPNSKKSDAVKSITAVGRRAEYRVNGQIGTVTVFGVRDVQGLFGEGHASLSGSHRLTATINSAGEVTKIDLTEDRP